MTVAAILTCASLFAYDGDTVKCDGASPRPVGNDATFLEGFDAPEIGGHAECEAERGAGAAAKLRIDELLRTTGLTV